VSDKILSYHPYFTKVYTSKIACQLTTESFKHRNCSKTQAGASRLFAHFLSLLKALQFQKAAESSTPVGSKSAKKDSRRKPDCAEILK
jgi:hypothetical protein